MRRERCAFFPLEKRKKRQNSSTVGAQIFLKQPKTFMFFRRYVLCSNIWIKIHLGGKMTNIQVHFKEVNRRKRRLLDLPRKRDSLQIYLQ